MATKKKSAVKKSTVKKIAAKKSAVKKNKEENTKSKKLNLNQTDKYKIVFNITAISPSEEDYSGTTITEWFDTGREVDNYASPDGYTFSPIKNSYKVKWTTIINEKLPDSLLNEIKDQIMYWANIFDATIESGSKISYIDSDGKEFKTYSFDKQEWL